MQACKNQPASAEEIPEKKINLKQAALYNSQLGLAYLEKGHVPRAKKKLLIALEQDPASADVHAALGYFFEHTKNRDMAKKHYVKAITLAPNSGAQMNNYGAFLCEQGNYTEAETWFMKAVQDIHYLNTAAAYENAGFCAVKANNFVKAEIWLLKALEQDSGRRKALYKLVKIKSDKNKYEEALTYLQKYPDLTLSDKLLVALAKEVAQKANNSALAAYYLQYYKKFDQHAHNGGVNNDNIG